MKKRVATLILNRNLPEVTEALYEQISQYDSELTDIFVIESGSDDDLKSRYSTWHADWDIARSNGLRYFRGMNFGLANLFKSNRLKDYEAFLLLANDTVLEQRPFINDLMRVLDSHPKVGVVSPCSKDWGEKLFLQNESVKYFWTVNPGAYLVRKELIEDICELDNPNEMNFLFDGSNFRGYGVDIEMIARAYANEWAVAITSKVMMAENDSYLLEKSDLVKTEPYDEHMRLYIEEGLQWMKKKFGFNSHWSMQVYVKCFYNEFFKMNPHLIEHKI